MKVNINKSRDFIIVWQKGTVDLYLNPKKGNYETAYNDLQDEDLRILKGLWNHLNSKKRNLEYAALEQAIEEVISALDKIFEERS